jgi:hypothetical protein
MEQLDLERLPDRPVGMLETFGESIVDNRVDLKARPEKRILGQILAEMMAIDPIRAKTTMTAWATFVQLASRTRMKPFDTLKDYIPARVIDAGEL